MSRVEAFTSAVQGDRVGKYVKFAERKMLFQIAFLGIIGSLLAEGSVLLAFEPWLDMPVALGWLFVMVSLTLMKGLVVWLSRCNTKDDEAPSSLAYFGYGCLASLEAMGWGSTMWIIFPVNPIGQAGLLMLCFGLAVGSLAIFFCSLPIYLIFSSTILVCASLRVWQLGGEPYHILALLIWVLLSVLAMVAIRVVRTFRDNIILGISNRELAERESVTNDVLLQVNEVLAERKEEVERRTEQMRRFVGIVSHDLRSHFGAISQLVDYLAEDAISPTRRAKVVGQIKKTTELGLKFVRDVLDLTSLETGKLSLEFHLKHISDVLDNVLTLVKPAAERKEIQIVQEVHDNQLIRIDAPRIEQVLNNLITNAIKFTPKGGRITIHTEATSDGLAVKVQDSGVGIRPEVLPNLFKKDIRTSTKGTMGEVGVGLGLPLSQEIVVGHGSSIKVESAAGIGSTFSFILPWASNIHK